MAYIDKDKALNLDFRINVSLFESRRKTAERAVQAYADAISAIPAADVRPVVRGRWRTALTDDNGFWANYCDQCNTYLPYGIEWFPNYCPNCGARMEES